MTEEGKAEIRALAQTIIAAPRVPGGSPAAARALTRGRVLAQDVPDLLTALEEADELLAEVLNQACGGPDGLDSMALSAYADGIRYLATRGKVEITFESGKRVQGRWKEEQP